MHSHNVTVYLRYSSSAGEILRTYIDHVVIVVDKGEHRLSQLTHHLSCTIGNIHQYIRGCTLKVCVLRLFSSSILETPGTKRS